MDFEVCLRPTSGGGSSTEGRTIKYPDVFDKLYFVERQLIFTLTFTPSVEGRYSVNTF